MTNKKNKPVRVRLAPSPTGSLHIGTARVGLFNYLFAKQKEGKFIIRIEDTDKERSEKKYEEGIIEGLKWLNINWDEGPDVKGEFGPYRQSKRIKKYKKYLKKLLEEGEAYHCFCSEEELNEMREKQRKKGEAPRYTGKCRSLSEKEVQKKLKAGQSSVIRFKTKDHEIEFNDIIRGKVSFDGSLIGDFVIAKDLEAPLYNFAVVVDDYEMKISHVIRGEDHISNTPKQIFIYKALGLPIPKFAHLPLILGEDESKLSKRHGAVSIQEFKKEGYLPEALINFIALLGWNSGTEKEIYTMSELIKNFSLKRVQKSGAIFNKDKLKYINGVHIRNKSTEEITKLCLPYLKEKFLKEVSQGKYKIKEFDQEISIKTIQKIISLYHERLKLLSEITELVDFFFKKEISYKKELLQWKKMEDNEIKKALENAQKALSNIKEWKEERIKDVLLKESEKEGDRGRLLWPVRAALTGKEASAGPFEIAAILGKEKTIYRVKKAIEKLS
ncbi:MAG: glutamate--tRNA ligase [Minisyncoccales bacterium]